MGIKNLLSFLRDTCPSAFETIHLSEYALKKVAIDISIFMYRFKYKKEDWLREFIDMVSCLRKNEIHCVFIYEGKHPDEKQQEKQERLKRKQQNETELFKLETALQDYITTGIVSDVLLETQNKNKKYKSNTSLLFKSEDTNVVKPLIDIDVITDKINKRKASMYEVSNEDFLLTKKLFDIMKIPYYDAPSEAETCCADLCKRGIVDAVLSADSDVLAYETPIFLTNFNMFNSTCCRLNLSHILTLLEINYNTFLDFCIMCGNDYNKNMPQIGPKTAFEYIKKYKSIEELENNKDNLKKKLDISILNYKRTRELFTKYPMIDISYVPYCAQPDFETLVKLLSEVGISMNIEKLKVNFTNEIVFL